MSDSEFKDKVVVITGAGGGLGKAHALEFASRGAKVVVNDLGGAGDGTGSGDAADVTVSEIKAAGGAAIANKSSVATPEGAKSIIDDAVAEFGTVDILINNAGILRDKSFKKMALDDWDIVMDVHLNGTAYVTHAAWPIMYDKNWGRVVFTSSTSGIYGNFGQANYGAAKMGMLGLMNVLSKEGASKNVRVNCLAPAAETRLIGTIPGREVNPGQPGSHAPSEAGDPGGAADVQRRSAERRHDPGRQRPLFHRGRLQQPGSGVRCGRHLRGSARAQGRAAGHERRGRGVDLDEGDDGEAGAVLASTSPDTT